MTTSVSKTTFVQEDLIEVFGISNRHSNRALVSMDKLIKTISEISNLTNTLNVIYNNLWVELVNKSTTPSYKKGLVKSSQLLQQLSC